MSQSPCSLVASGGGSRGAYTVGALRALYEAGRSYSYMAGVSVGALITGLLAQYSPSEQRTGHLELSEIWRGLKGNESIYVRWFFWGKLAALWKGGLYDTSPLRKLVYKHYNAENLKKSGVLLRMGAVALGSGEYRTFTEKEPEKVPEGIMASSAFPAAFPPVHLDGDWWLDGGVRDITPVRDALKERTTGPIDVVITSPVQGDRTIVKYTSTPGLFQLGPRAISLMADEVFVTDLASIPESEKARVRIFAPEAALHDPLDFDPALLERAMTYGYERTRDEIKHNPL